MRIQAGVFKGRTVLPPPGGSEVRPITGAARKSLFDILGGRLVDAAVADLYCGTGTIGLEALSRGARTCCFADRDRRVIERLRRNIEAFGVADRCVIWQGDVTARLSRWLEDRGEALDVAFVDPPYAQSTRWDWQQAAERIFAPLAQRLASEGVVVLRVPPRLEPPEPLGGMRVIRRQRYGGTAVALLAAAGETE